jgi:erythromycin esterase-like protein
MNYGSALIELRGRSLRRSEVSAIWMILRQGVRYEERSPALSEESKRVRTAPMVRTLQIPGYCVELSGKPA